MIAGERQTPSFPLASQGCVSEEADRATHCDLFPRTWDFKQSWKFWVNLVLAELLGLYLKHLVQGIGEVVKCVMYLPHQYKDLSSG